jgi:hypothetical protein
MAENFLKKCKIGTFFGAHSPLISSDLNAPSSSSLLPLFGNGREALAKSSFIP